MKEAELEALFTEITGKPFPKDLQANDPFPAVCADPAHALGCGAAPEQFFDFSEFTEPAAAAADAAADATHAMDAPLDAAHDALSGLLHEHPMRRMIRICETSDIEPLEFLRNRDNTISMYTHAGVKKPYPVKIGASGSVRATERFPGLPNVMVATNILPLGRQIFKEDYHTVKRLMGQAGVGPLFNVSLIRFESSERNRLTPRETFNAIRNRQPGSVETVAGVYYYPRDVLVVDALWGWMMDRGRYTHTMCHELGHRFHFGSWAAVPPGLTASGQKNFDRWNNEQERTRPFDRHVKAMFLAAQSNSALVVSEYALTTYHEFWAEVFGLYVQGRLNHRPKLKRWANGVLATFKRSNLYC